MQANIVIVSGSILSISTVYFHLTGFYLAKLVLGGHPVLSGHNKNLAKLKRVISSNKWKQSEG